MTSSQNKTGKNSYTFTVGRRKSAVSTVKLYSGKGDSSINGTPVEKYFAVPGQDIRYTKPFTVTNTAGKYHFSAKIIGGGKNGQLDALVLGISRGLIKIDPNFKPELRAADLLTVDSRVRERRMVGTGGKARRQKQSPKR